MTVSTQVPGEQPRDANGQYRGYPFDRAESIRLSTMSGPMAFEFSDDPDSMSDEDYNAGGSYDYPPAPRSPGQVRSFWATVNVPDTALSHYARTYRVDVERFVSHKLRQWDQTHPMPNPRSDIAPSNDAWKQERAEAEQEFRAERAPEVPRHLLRTAVRSVGMKRDAMLLPEAERNELLRSPVHVPGEGVSTLHEVAWKYGMRFQLSTEEALTPTAELQTRRFEDLAEEMRESREDLAYRIAGVAGTVDGMDRGLHNVFTEEDRRAGRLRR